jgi:hypothetical protein
MKPPKGIDGAYPVFLMKCFDIMYLIIYFGIGCIKYDQYQKWELDGEQIIWVLVAGV